MPKGFWGGPTPLMPSKIILCSIDATSSFLHDLRIIRLGFADRSSYLSLPVDPYHVAHGPERGKLLSSYISWTEASSLFHPQYQHGGIVRPERNAVYTPLYEFVYGEDGARDLDHYPKLEVLWAQ